MTDQTPPTSEQLLASIGQLTAQIQNLTQNQTELLARVAAAETSAAAAAADAGQAAGLAQAAGQAAGAAQAAAASPQRTPRTQQDDRAALETLKAGRALLGPPPEWSSNGDKSVRFWAESFLAHAQNTATAHFMQGLPALLLVKAHVDQDTQTWLDNKFGSGAELPERHLTEFLNAIVEEFTDVARYQRAYQSFSALTAQPAGVVDEDSLKTFNAEFNARAQRVNREATSVINELSAYQQLQQYAQVLPAIVDESHVQLQTLINTEVTTTVLHEFQRAAEVRYKAWFAKYTKEHSVRTPPKTLLAPLNMMAQPGAPPPRDPPPSPMDIGSLETDEAFIARIGFTPTGGYPKKLTPDEKKRCMRLGLCFRCRQAGHRAESCPLREQGNGPAPGK